MRHIKARMPVCQHKYLSHKISSIFLVQLSHKNCPCGRTCTYCPSRRMTLVSCGMFNTIGLFKPKKHSQDLWCHVWFKTYNFNFLQFFSKNFVLHCHSIFPDNCIVNDITTYIDNVETTLIDWRQFNVGQTTLIRRWYYIVNVATSFKPIYNVETTSCARCEVAVKDIKHEFWRALFSLPPNKWCTVRHSLEKNLLNLL